MQWAFSALAAAAWVLVVVDGSLRVAPDSDVDNAVRDRDVDVVTVCSPGKLRSPACPACCRVDRGCATTGADNDLRVGGAALDAPGPPAQTPRAQNERVQPSGGRTRGLDRVVEVPARDQWLTDHGRAEGADLL